MQMINVLQRLAELDAQNPRVEKPKVMETPVLGGNGIKQLDVNMPEPDMKTLRQLSGLMESREFSNTIAECGMPGMGAPMPMTPASLSMTAGNANEIVTMMRGLADIASGASHSGMQGMGAPMPHGADMLGGGDMPSPMDLDHDGDMDGVAMDMGAEPEMGGDELGGGPMGGDELADMVNKLKTGQPVKISTNMPVKVKTSNPVSGGEKDEGFIGTGVGGVAGGALGGMAGGALGTAVGGPIGGAIGGAVGDVAGTALGAKVGDNMTGDEEDESMAEDLRVWDTSPKEHTRDYNPNDFAQMFNKIKDIDQAKAATRADNPLKRESVEEAQPADSLTELTNKLFSDYQAFVNESRTKEGNKFGQAVRNAKKDGVQPGEKIKVDGKSYPVKEADKQTMSRAAKGNEKYGKAGMQALAKAGREGKNLDKVRDKYNKYDEAYNVNGVDAEHARKIKAHHRAELKKKADAGDENAKARLAQAEKNDAARRAEFDARMER
jgi:hypothetical protein